VVELSAEAKAFEELVRQGRDPRVAAVEFCLSLGIAPDEAEKRVRELEPVFAELGPGEEDVLALLLDLGDLFVVDRPLDARRSEIRDLLARAAGAMGDRIPSGLAKSLRRWFRTGELNRAFLVLAAEHRQPRPGGSPSVHWSALAAAGDLLPGDDEETQRAREHCRRMAARYPVAEEGVDSSPARSADRP
jgi:hypothetical protein